jgi:hypothetical protein
VIKFKISDIFTLFWSSVTYLRLDGSVEPEKRFDIVKAFNSDPTIDALLLTTHGKSLFLPRFLKSLFQLKSMKGPKGQIMKSNCKILHILHNDCSMNTL